MTVINPEPQPIRRLADLNFVLSPRRFELTGICRAFEIRSRLSAAQISFRVKAYQSLNQNRSRQLDNPEVIFRLLGVDFQILRPELSLPDTFT